MPMIPLPPPPMGAPPPGVDPGMGAPPQMGGMGPVPLPPVPAEQAGMAAMSLVPVQQAQQAALTQQQTQELLGMLASQLASAPNPAAEGLGGMPAPMVTPDGGGATVGDPNDPFGGA